MIWLSILLLLVGSAAVFGNRPFSTSTQEREVIQSFSPAPSPIATSKPYVKPIIRQKVLLQVPFVAQAPAGNWDDPRQQDGCEEVAAWMAIMWAKGENPPASFAEQEKRIQEIADWEEEKYGSYHDTSMTDTLIRIYNDYFGYEDASLVEDVTLNRIKKELSSGNLVQIPADGRKLKNPYYTQPGPERHNLLIIGYDDATGEFITNDNGTRQGKGYKYKYDVVLGAIRDYPTGFHEPISSVNKAMIVISKEES